MALDSRSEILFFPFTGTGSRTRPAIAKAALGLVPRVAVPTFDLLALVAAVSMVGRAGALGAAYAAAAAVVIALQGGYRSRISPSLGQGLPALLGQLALPLVPLGALAARAGEATDLLLAVPLAMAFTVTGRAMSYSLIRQARARGLVLDATLIIGAGKLGVQIAETLQQHPEYGLVPVGFLDGFDDHDLPLPILGRVGDLDGVIREFAVERVIIAFGSTREAEMVRVLRACDRHRVEVHVLPRFFEMGVAPEGVDTDDVWGIPLLRLRRSALRTVAWRTKRAFDVTVSTVALLVTAPVFALAALAVRLSSPGPVFFRQRRVGQSGRLVEILKFRTLRMNDDSDTTWDVSTDSRLTSVGRFLRRTSVDELPQLLNVLKGDMSLVGPRPERPYFVEQFNATVPRYGDRHRVPVGLTGWAQVHKLRGDTSIEERARFDNHYIEHWSLWRDVIICLRTLTAMWHSPRNDDAPAPGVNVVDVTDSAEVLRLDRVDLDQAL